MAILKVGYLVAVTLQFLRRIKSIISMAFAHQLLGILAVKRFSLALAVWRVRAAGNRAFIRHQHAPVQAIDNILFGPLYIAVLVGILNAQNKIAAMLFGKQVIEQHR